MNIICHVTSDDITGLRVQHENVEKVLGSNLALLVFYRSFSFSKPPVRLYACQRPCL